MRPSGSTVGLRGATLVTYHNLIVAICVVAAEWTAYWLGLLHACASGMYEYQPRLERAVEVTTSSRLFTSRDGELQLRGSVTDTAYIWFPSNNWRGESPDVCCGLERKACVAGMRVEDGSLKVAGIFHSITTSMGENQNKGIKAFCI